MLAFIDYSLILLFFLGILAFVLVLAHTPADRGQERFESQPAPGSEDNKLSQD